MNDSCIEPREGREMELAFFAGGDLASEAAARVEAHLAACPACRSFVEGLRASQEGLAALAGEPLDPEALARVRHAVRRRIEDEARRSATIQPWALALAAGLALALVGAALWLWGTAPWAPERSSPPRERVVAAPVTPPAPAERPAEAPEAARAPDLHRMPAPAAEAPVRQAATVPRATPEPARPASPVQAAPSTPTEPMVIQVVSDDPDIVFYWLVEPEETEDATVTS
jgi:anti-sigma factor RsiW